MSYVYLTCVPTSSDGTQLTSSVKSSRFCACVTLPLRHHINSRVSQPHLSSPLDFFDTHVPTLASVTLHTTSQLSLLFNTAPVAPRCMHQNTFPTCKIGQTRSLLLSQYPNVVCTPERKADLLSQLSGSIQRLQLVRNPFLHELETCRTKIHHTETPSITTTISTNPILPDRFQLRTRGSTA
ncbi:hypothetical protein BJ508DRAFT_58184 [Ascobolus immersus RN42]|uniref:Uncharacterized protein n=1 Tax=Ascobolus immersus RN42 TaxID=1160509 RepID=A0A3N4HJ36_ASCIM|nr:hypothetical protein BJ508DRAFT_58184 [Ascobolus immersus RN42]